MQVWCVSQKKSKEPKNTEKKKLFKPCLNQKEYPRNHKSADMKEIKIKPVLFSSKTYADGKTPNFYTDSKQSEGAI